MIDEIDHKELERLRAAQRITNDYHRTFGSDYGKRTLDDLAKAFGLTDAVFTPVSRGDHALYDPITAALADGARRVIIHIRAQLARSPMPDDAVEAKERVQR
jgi:hypothetical protein